MEIPVEVLVSAQRERIDALTADVARLQDENMQLKAAYDFYRGVVDGLARQAEEHAQAHAHDEPHPHDEEQSTR